jgi:hypothetical protein
MRERFEQMNDPYAALPPDVRKVCDLPTSATLFWSAPE